MILIKDNEGECLIKENQLTIMDVNGGLIMVIEVIINNDEAII